jgi:hypothetical protein
MPPKKKVENTINIVEETPSNLKSIDSETKKSVKKSSKKSSKKEVFIEQHASIACSTIKEVPCTSVIEEKKKMKTKKEKVKDIEKESELNQENIEQEIDKEREKFKILLEESNKIEQNLEIARNNFKILLNESNEIEKNLEITRTNLKNLLDKLKINDNTVEKNNIKKQKETTIEISDTD